MLSWTSLPFSTTSLLGLEKSSTDALVLDGMVLQLGDRRHRTGETQILVNGLPRVVQCCMPLKDLLSQTLRRHRQDIDLWVQRAHTNLNLLDRDLPFMQAADTAAIGRFVRERLIPRLQAERGTASLIPPTPKAREIPEDSTEAAIQSVLSVQLWPRWFAFYHSTWYGLVPFSGQPLNGRLHLVWKDQAFIGMSKERWSLAIRSCDQRLEEAISYSFQQREQKRMQPHVLYQDPSYRVLCAPKRHYFICRQLSPYVVEGPDRLLYGFPGVQVGVPITSLEVDQVLTPFSARVMHAYRHMFAHSSGASAPICMPLPAEYYARLPRLPLEEALLQHLEAARMTLCAGYHEGNRSAPLHDIRRLNIAPISPKEAQARGLPVYRFFRKVKEVR